MYERNLKPRSRKVTITLPEEYVGKLIHITANPLRSEKNKETTHHTLEEIFKPVLDTKKVKFNREEAHER